MTGRIVMSSYETLRAAGTSVICLSPWGDSSPLLLPCIRFRDLAFHVVIAATGGTAAIAAPVLGPASDILVSSLGDTIIVEMGVHAGFELGIKAADDLVIEHPLERLIPSKDKRLMTTAIKTMTITLKHKHTVTDAALGFFRSSVHKDSSLFSDIKDYLSIEKGWFSPYLFASNRRPVIPRSMKPDVVFCHGPFLSGDYRVGQTLFSESATVIQLCQGLSEETGPTTLSPQATRANSATGPADSGDGYKDPYPKYRPISNYIARKRHESAPNKDPQDSASIPNPNPASASSGGGGGATSTAATVTDPVPAAAPPERRLLITVVGIKPHRTSAAWSTSHRPEESIIRYQMLNGVPSLVIPAKTGCPLVAWDTLTLDSFYKIDKERGAAGVQGVADVLVEYLSFCIDWERVLVPDGFVGDGSASDGEKEAGEGRKKQLLKDAVGVLVAGIVKSRESKAVKDDVDLDRAGVVMFRIP